MKLVTLTLPSYIVHDVFKTVIKFGSNIFSSSSSRFKPRMVCSGLKYANITAGHPSACLLYTSCSDERMLAYEQSERGYAR